ncbi:hypothetical protein [Teredinibacter sp. KSP-S5-2]|uniref:hypothetical protein n=1 Tax=Teredinibacter sp. KSP-S5-2 TaxID=3034506 RepID=UPI00293417E0|nr:hypothetical protein [Teredinibacter sp. KSP-S5-2]WNO10599.1 hypothetical protein P5V12_05370 [Teredinibacter sp. KSP-S5-2]
MGKVVYQFKTINDLSEVIKEYETLLMRPTRRYSHPTLYRYRDVGKNEKLLSGVRVKDWLFSHDQHWVLPHDQMGLSFSSTYKNLKDVYRLKSKHNPGKKLDVYWVLETSNIPLGLKFVPDRNKKGHYFLTVTEATPLSQLVIKLKMLAHRMTRMKNVGFD